MHVLAAEIYVDYKEALAQRPEAYSRWFAKAVTDGQLRGNRLQDTVKSFFSSARCQADLSQR
jgi:hypothetical protein